MQARSDAVAPLDRACCLRSCRACSRQRPRRRAGACRAGRSDPCGGAGEETTAATETAASPATAVHRRSRSTAPPASACGRTGAQSRAERGRTSRSSSAASIRALYPVLKRFGFRYDASRLAPLGQWPQRKLGIWSGWHEQRLDDLVHRLRERLPVAGFPAASSAIESGCRAFERDPSVRARLRSELLLDALPTAADALRLVA